MTRKLIALLAALALALAGALAEESTAGIWKLAYYVDEFRMPTNDAYIRNAEPIEGIFSNSATTDSKLGVVILLDENDLAFILYEYGNNQVKNPYSHARAYDVTLRDALGSKTSLSGSMPASGDRILFTGSDKQTILSALAGNPSVSFYIAEAENPVTNYLFTIADTSGFAEVRAALQTVFDERDYRAAAALWDAGDYKRALSAFAALGDYRDSAEWDGRYRAMMYEKAEALLAEKDYAAANAAFTEAGDYEDAKARVGEPYYVQAEELLAAGEYAAASKAFANAGSYSDAKARVGEPYYIQAEELLTAGEYAAANEAFVNAGNYSDAKERILEPYYRQAEELLAAGEYEAASEAFTNAGNYSDAKERILEPYYRQAEALLANGDEYGAIMAFKAAGGYSDAVKRWKAIYYSQAEALLEAREYEAANDAFIHADDYSDAVDRVGEPYYIQAGILLSEKKYDDAIEAYSNAGLYSDAKEKIPEVYYEKAMSLKEEGSYDDAYETFLLINDYKDVAAILEQDEHMLTAAYNYFVAQFDVGNTVTYGVYEQDHDSGNGLEPIQWLVVGSDGSDRRLLVSIYGLDTKPYDTTKVNAKWSNSTLRSWLNKEFIDSCFTDEERKRIVTTSLSNPRYNYTDGKLSGYGEETKDRVFLLSIEEAQKYYPDKASRVAQATQQAVFNGAYTSKLGNSWRWLRTQGAIGGCVAYIDFDGSIRHRGDYAYLDNACIQPAMWVSLVRNADSIDVESEEEEKEAYPTLQKGSKGDDVKKLQQALIDGGYLSGKADGDFGKGTESAVKAAQQALGFDADGIAGDAFQKKLYGE